MAQQTGISNMADVITAEYREMPCLSLTKPQMQRLWGLETIVCDALVDALVKRTRAAQDRDWYICGWQRQPLTLLPRAP